jgi:hypothetical protein
MERVSVYPFHFTNKYIYAWAFRRDPDGIPILHSLRLKRYPKRDVIIIARKRKPDA